MLTFNTFIPFVVIFLSYKLIFSKTKKALKSRNTERCRRYQSQKKILKTTVLIVASYIFCWGPSFVYYFLQAICKTCLADLYRREDTEKIITFLMKVLTFINGIFAPLVYCFLNTNFNAERQKTIRRLRTSTIQSLRPRTLSSTVDYKDRRRSSPLCDQFDQKDTPFVQSPKPQNDTGTIFVFVGKNDIESSLV